MATFDARAQKMTVKVMRGNRWRIPTVLVVGPEDDEEALDLTDYTDWKAEIGTHPDRKDPDFAVVQEITVTVEDAEEGRLLLVVDESDTQDFILDTYFWDLQSDHPVIGPYTWLKGPWIVSEDVTE